MLFHKTIEKLYQAQIYRRCDETGMVHCFSYQDFPGLKQKAYRFKSSLGHNLQGYFYHYDNYDENRLIIFEHGFGGGHRSYMKEIELLCRAGYLVFAYDHTGCMESGGESTMGLAQSLHDLDDCVKALIQDETINTEDISVVGHSWGGFSALNIVSLQPVIKRIVVISGFISVERMINQNFSGILKGYRKHILKLEAETNPYYVGYDATKTLVNFDVKGLLIYSDNDHLVRKDMHYDALSEALKDKENIELVLLHDKGHNPNYTSAAVSYLSELSEKLKKVKNLKTEQEKEQFKNSFDWNKMTEQDEEVWNQILEFLK